jgi:hypothetical protein
VYGSLDLILYFMTVVASMNVLNYYNSILGSEWLRTCLNT